MADTGFVWCLQFSQQFVLPSMFKNIPAQVLYIFVHINDVNQTKLVYKCESMGFSHRVYSHLWWPLFLHRIMSAFFTIYAHVRASLNRIAVRVPPFAARLFYASPHQTQCKTSHCIATRHPSPTFHGFFSLCGTHFNVLGRETEMAVRGVGGAHQKRIYAFII